MCQYTAKIITKQTTKIANNNDEYPDHRACGRLCATVFAAQPLSQAAGQVEHIRGLAGK